MCVQPGFFFYFLINCNAHEKEKWLVFISACAWLYTSCLREVEEVGGAGGKKMLERIIEFAVRLSEIKNDCARLYVYIDIIKAVKRDFIFWSWIMRLGEYTAREQILGRKRGKIVTYANLRTEFSEELLSLSLSYRELKHRNPGEEAFENWAHTSI